MMHQDIVYSLIAQKLELKRKYDISFSLANAVKAHNNNLHSVTKFSPNYLFHNCQEISNELIHDRMASSQNYAKKKLNLKFKQKGKYIIPRTIDGAGNGIRYPIRIDVDYKDLI
jgi:hypothetical protein